MMDIIAIYRGRTNENKLLGLWYQSAALGILSLLNILELWIYILISWERYQQDGSVVGLSKASIKRRHRGNAISFGGQIIGYKNLTFNV
jgi:hypothetical protein